MYLREIRKIMERKFVNFTNHPSSQWEEKQRKAAQQYVEKIMKLKPRFVLCQGEFCLTFKTVEKWCMLYVEIREARLGD